MLFVSYILLAYKELFPLWHIILDYILQDKGVYLKMFGKMRKTPSFDGMFLVTKKISCSLLFLKKLLVILRALLVNGILFSFLNQHSKYPSRTIVEM